MTAEGPPLEVLTHRLADIPQDFLGEPRTGRVGSIHVDAVVHDVLNGLGLSPSLDELAHFGASQVPEQRGRLAIALLFCWLLADDSFKQLAVQSVNALNLLHDDAALLAGQTSSAKIVRDADRREELVRLTLARLGYRPRGETQAQAEDRLASVSSIERNRVIQAARAAEERARAVREALVKKRAQESADKFTRE